jgi:hypothetical protein
MGATSPIPLNFLKDGAGGGRDSAYVLKAKAVADVCVEVSAFGFCRHQFGMSVRRNVKVPVDITGTEFQLEQTALREVQDRSQEVGINSHSNHAESSLFSIVSWFPSMPTSKTKNN